LLANWQTSAYKSFVSLTEFVAAKGTSFLAFLMIVSYIIGLVIDNQSMFFATY